MKKLTKEELLELLEKLNLKDEISIDEIDGVLLKQMAMSNVIKSNRPSTNTGKQTHIALTSQERSLFPLVSSVTYYENEEKPKFYDFKLPVKLLKSNVTVLDTENTINFEGETLDTYTLCYIRKDTSGFQVQLSKTTEDEKNFIDFRKLMFENDYLGIIKLKGELKFIFLAYKESSIDVSDKSILYIDDKSNTLLSEDDLYKETGDRLALEEKTTIYSLSEEEVLILSLYLSKFSEKALNYLKVKTWKEAYIKIAERSEEYSNPKSINNLKDHYDPYFENGRKGWHQKPLIPKYKNILDKYRYFEKEELEDVIGLFWLGRVSKINKPLNRIVYGAPGTGKSYKLNEEAKDSFPNIIFKREEIKEVDEEEYVRNYWLVGATWGNSDKFSEFTSSGYWENGYQDKYLDKVKSIKAGDYIGIKALNRHTNSTKVKALGIVTNSDGKKIEVNWLIFEEKEYFKRRYNLTIHKVHENRLDMFNPLVEYEKRQGKEVEVITSEINAIERVTFYDGYTYGQFVGSYKPVPKDESITYEYVAGPFMRQLVKAYKNPTDNFCLIIEEINRARADKLFGNIFQLLDRGGEGKSQYPVSLSQEQLLYLQKELGEDDQEILDILLTEGLYIPKNLYIWATMNSADQGVYPLDTAFKRRWSFEHIGLNENESKLTGLKVRLEKDLEVEWNDFRKEINESLLSIKVSEDRLLAPFFVKKEEFIDGILDSRVFIDKILVYLFDDVLRHKKKEVLFKKGINSFSNLKEKLSSDGKIFKDEFYEKFYSETKLKSYSSSESEVEGVAAPNEPYNDGVE